MVQSQNLKTEIGNIIDNGIVHTIEKNIHNILDVALMILSGFYFLLTLYFFTKNPYNFLTNTWRYPILGIPYYAPYVHDTFLYSIFSFAVLWNKSKGWIGILFVWMFQETAFNWTSINKWTTFEKIDSYYYMKVGFFTLMLVLTILLIIKFKYKMNFSKLNISLLIGYWIFSIIVNNAPQNPTTPYFSLMIIPYLIVMYRIVK